MKVARIDFNLELCFDTKKEIEFLPRNPLNLKFEDKKFILTYERDLPYFRISFDRDERVKEILTKNNKNVMSDEEFLKLKEETWKKVKIIELSIGEGIYEDIEVSGFANISFENGDQIGFIGVG